METLRSHNPLLSLLFLYLLQFSSLSLLSSAYTLPNKYFINCGSNSDVSVTGAPTRNFISDENSGSFSLFGETSSVSDTNTSNSSPLYQTARIFTNPSSYVLQIDQSGTYMVRLHFNAFSSSKKNLSNAQFNVSASGFSLLSNFSVQNLIINEFMLTINVSEFIISFTPTQKSSFAFANAIEVFLVPNITDVSTPPPNYVTPSGARGTYDGLLSQALHTVYRANVGGPLITPAKDTLWRNWVSDDDYLVTPNAAKKSEFHSDRPVYQTGGATEYSAPDLVYQTAKKLNVNSSAGSNFFNMTWRFNVSKNAPHFVRVHFCDIVSTSINDVLQFNLYRYSKFSQNIYPYNVVGQLAVPFYQDFVVDSDNSGFLDISIGPRNDSIIKTAFLNGVEIMEVITGLGLVTEVKKPPKKHLFVVVGSVIGSVASLLMLVVVVVVCLNCKRAKPVETSVWQAIPDYGGGSSYVSTTERTVNGFPLDDLNLGLKLSFQEILFATNNFDTKLMIGAGGFGKVYKATLRNGMKVAVKRSEPGNGQGRPEFHTEIIVLSSIRHRHLVSLIGYCDERSEMILVYEFMEKGTLRDHLYILNGESQKSSSQSELSWNQRLQLCIGAAKGLDYLHNSSGRGIIHRDVKSTNILLDEDYVAKVADFGLSRLGDLDQTHVSTGVKGSFGYLDPEYFRCLQLTQKSDAYSFGVVLLEVLCARPAINNSLPGKEENLAEWGLFWQKKGQLENIVDPLLVGKINPNSLRKFGETVEKCLKEYGVQRPNMNDVVWDLEYALQLQQTARHREPHEDSTTDASWVLPVPAIQQLPSHSIPIDEYDIPMDDFTDTSRLYAQGVFSMLNIDDGR
ncbi:putative receptor-like protein kinase [Camellia lanceoleosa]|uniref:Receptor-like protein kinase n=1 Tax=Camellia lanceoleosa TaxID=1840588 RepID=A0ACC0J0V5_9ERIC|nr:putative receptor-like protein kinase [Camellia lanceoleosa]